MKGTMKRSITIEIAQKSGETEIEFRERANITMNKCVGKITKILNKNGGIVGLNRGRYEKKNVSSDGSPQG
jgi:hypothetical protein